MATEADSQHTKVWQGAVYISPDWLMGLEGMPQLPQCVVKAHDDVEAFRMADNLEVLFEEVLRLRTALKDVASPAMSGAAVGKIAQSALEGPGWKWEADP